MRYPCLAQWARHAASSPLEVPLVRWQFVVLGERTLWSLGCLPALLAMGYTSALSQGLRRSWILARDGLWPRGNSTWRVCWEAPWPSPVQATKPAMLTAPDFVRPVQWVHEPCQARELKQGGPAQCANSSGREAGEPHCALPALSNQ